MLNYTKKKRRKEIQKYMTFKQRMIYLLVPPGLVDDEEEKEEEDEWEEEEGNLTVREPSMHSEYEEVNMKKNNSKKKTETS